MSFESNNGSVYYQLSCGIPSDVGWNPNTNNGSKYYWLSADDFILWGQDTVYVAPSANNGTSYYFYLCHKATDTNWSPLSNNGTKFFYSSAFNCVSFCDQ